MPEGRLPGDGKVLVRLVDGLRHVCGVALLAGDTGTSPGTKVGIDESDRIGRPRLVAVISDPATGARIVEFLDLLDGAVLHVCGPRESEGTGIHALACDRLMTLLAPVRLRGGRPTGLEGLPGPPPGD